MKKLLLLSGLVLLGCNFAYADNDSLVMYS